MEAVLTVQSVKPEAKRLNLFERYLPIWVGLCMVVGVVLGKGLPVPYRPSEAWTSEKEPISMFQLSF